MRLIPANLARRIPAILRCDSALRVARVVFAHLFDGSWVYARKTGSLHDTARGLLWQRPLVANLGVKRRLRAVISPIFRRYSLFA